MQTLCSSPDDALSAWRQMACTFLKMQRQLEEMIAPHGLVISQFEALAKIAMKPGMIQQELVCLLLMTKGNVGALLDRLESIGLVERRTDPNDRRANRLHLTETGHDLMSDLLGKYRQFIHDLFEPLNSEQRQTLRTLLKALEPDS